MWVFSCVSQDKPNHQNQEQSSSIWTRVLRDGTGSLIRTARAPHYPSAVAAVPCAPKLLGTATRVEWFHLGGFSAQRRVGCGVRAVFAVLMRLFSWSWSMCSFPRLVYFVTMSTAATKSESEVEYTELRMLCPRFQTMVMLCWTARGWPDTGSDRRQQVLFTFLVMDDNCVALLVQTFAGNRARSRAARSARFLHSCGRRRSGLPCWFGTTSQSKRPRSDRCFQRP